MSLTYCRGKGRDIIAAAYSLLWMSLPYTAVFSAWTTRGRGSANKEEVVRALLRGCRWSAILGTCRDDRVEVRGKITIDGHDGNR